MGVGDISFFFSFFFSKKTFLVSPLFHNIFNISLTKMLNVVVRFICFFFSQFCKADMLRYRYLEVFQRVLWSSRY